jgi:hypothetical protein
VTGGRRVIVLLGGLLLAMAACASPEATRTRGGGAGADVGNHGSPVEIHGNLSMYHGTPHKGPGR